MAGFEIRPVAVSDLSLVLTLIRELAEYERLSHTVVATEEMLRAALFGERAFTEAVIGRHDGEPVAFALWFYNYSTFAGRPGLFVEDLFVRPHARGKGLGRAMLAYLANVAVERGCGRLEWLTLDWNKPAREFYERLGATSAGEWIPYRLSGKALERLAADGD
jgi:GNAT superfamily N-acetyltransferase